MDELSVVACVLAGLFLLWWWPGSETHRTRSAAHHSASDGSQALAQLRAELMVVASFDEALEHLDLSRTDLSARTFARLRQISLLNQRHGAVSSLLLDAVIADDVAERNLSHRWETASAGANSSSFVMMLMPGLMLALAQGLGTPAFGWLISSQLGHVCIVFGTGLTVIARLVLLRLKRFALNPHGEGRSRSKKQRKVLSADEAANIVFLLVLLLRPDVFGISLALAARGAIKRYWSRFSKNTHSQTSTDISWLCVVLAANLEAGLDWLRAVRAVADLEEGDCLESLRAVSQRLEWGLEPPEAFADAAPELEPIALCVAQTRRTGAPMTNVLISRSHSLRSDAVTRASERVEKIGAASVVPVAALQLPAFVILGLVPFVATQLGPMLAAFSSTG